MNEPEKLKEYLPLIAVVAVGLGYFDLYLYYMGFNIQIGQFITITEILTLFLDKIILYFIYTSVAVSYFFLLFHFEIKKDEKLFSTNFYINIITLFFIFGLLTSKLTDGFEREVFVGIIIMFIGYGFVVVFYTYAKSNSRHNIPMRFGAKLFFGVFFILFHALLVVFFALNRIQDKLNEYKTTTYDFQFDKTMRTDKELVYIGKTEKYYFFREPNVNNTIVIPAEKFQGMEVTKMK